MGSVVQAGTTAGTALIAEWLTAGADRAASFGPAAAGRRATHPPSGEERGVVPRRQCG